MALINLLPHVVKTAKPAKIAKARKSQAAKQNGPKFTMPKMQISLIFPIIPVLVVIAIVAGGYGYLSTQVKAQKKKVAGLEEGLKKVVPTHVKIDELTLTRNELKKTLAFYENMTAERVAWSQKAVSIHKDIPAQIWLSSITSKGGLVIRGNATSVVETEIIGAIINFVTRLKDDDAFIEGFAGIKIGQLQFSRKGKMSYMSFSLTCPFKGS